MHKRVQHQHQQHPPVRLRLLWLLLIVASLPHETAAFRKPRGRLLSQALLPFGYTFQFTSPAYNVSLKENTRNRPFVQDDAGEKIGIFLPPIFSKIRYKIVDGDKDKLFVADHIVFGDFAFLQIRPEKGEILNRERKSHYELVVKGTLKRKNANTLEATTRVNLRILDENDNSPMFRKVDYVASIDSNTPRNSRVIKLEAFDADDGLNGELYYSLTNNATDPVTSMFYIDSSSGWVRTLRGVEPGNYTLNCLVEDRASRLNFHNDADAPKPLFIRNKAKVVITVTPPAQNEGFRLNVTRHAIAPFADSIQKAAVFRADNVEEGTYEIRLVSVRGSDDVWLERSPQSADFLLLVGSTRNATIEVEVEAVDLVGSRERTVETVIVSLDQSKRSVEFIDPVGSISVDEILPIGSVVHQFAVRTSVAQDRSLVKFRLKTDSTDFPFHLDRISGQLKVKHKLDHETAKHFSFQVIAKIDGLEEAKAHRTIPVHILDANDNCPSWTSLPQGNLLRLPAKPAPVPGKTSLFTVKAADPDSGDNGRVFYRLQGPDAGQFLIDVVSGEIKLSQSFSLKNRTFWNVTVVAFDAGQPVSLAAFAELIMLVKNPSATGDKSLGKVWSSCSMANIHAPSFSVLPSGLSIPEDVKVGSIVGKVSAQDSDVGINGIVVYDTDDVYFGVEHWSGRIFTRVPLQELFSSRNRDSGSETVDYGLQVIATDLAGSVNASTPPKTDKATVTIRISDVNNHAPVFEKKRYFVHISESSDVGSELLKVKAIDLDPGRHGKIEYVLAVESDLISIDPDSGAVSTVRQFDREASPAEGRFEFLLAAFDRGDPSLFSFANLTVFVDDVNDNAPYCPQNIQVFRILEDAPHSHLAGCVVALDDDTGNNSRISFSLDQPVPRSPFRVDSQTGCFFVDSAFPLSAVRQSSYAFNVTLTDGGSPSLTGQCRVSIVVLAVNKNQMPPEFEQIAVEGSVKENAPIGTVVLQVSARDPEGKAVRYDLVGGSGLGYFDIDPETGLITTGTVLDFEQTASYWLTVCATDADEHPLSGYLSVLVRVLDKNDRAPLFEHPIYFAGIQENSEENKVVVKLEADDLDGVTRPGDPESTLRYSIVKGNAQALFQIDSKTGYLVTGKRKLDREAQREHELTVRVCDHHVAAGTSPNGLCAEALVVVEVLDANDNRPLFNASSNMVIAVPANKIGFLTRVFANDADADGPNSDIEYSFIGPLVDERLRIDRFGRISTVEALAPGSQLHVTVAAKDGGVPQLNSTITVTLEARGRSRTSSTNNKPPVFADKDSWRELYVSDSDPVGVIIGLVRAEDADNDPLWYSIASESQNPNETFAFKAATGELVLARSVSLIDPSIREVQLSVSVSDGIAEAIDSLVVHISRSSATPRPQFGRTSDTLTIEANAPIGVVLYTAKATFDESQTGVSHPHRLVYSIAHIDDVAARDVLRIDSHNGQIILEKTPTPQTARNFTLIVSAKVGSAENFLQLYVTRLVANEHAPKFIGRELVFEIPAETAEGVVGTVRAFDADGDTQLTFSIVGGNELGLFAIAPQTGHLSLLKPLPPLLKAVILTVRVSDSGTPQRSATTVVQVQVRETPASIKPVFAHETLQTALDDTAPKGRLVGLSAVLPGVHGVSRVTYAFDTLCEYLGADVFTGAVVLRKPLPLLSTDWTLNCSLLAINEAGNNASLPVHVKVVSSLAHLVAFTQPTFDGFVRENAAIGAAVFTDQAEQAPLQLSTTVPAARLRILTPREGPFALDAFSRALRLAQPVDFEATRGSWLFVVTGDALGRPPSLVSPPAVVKITIGNVNDHPPTIEAPVEIRVRSGAVPGTRVGQIVASDVDGNDTVTYGLKNVPGNILAVNRTTGVIFVAFNASKTLQTASIESGLAVASDGTHSSTAPLSVIVDKPTGGLRMIQDEWNISVVENQTTSTPRILLGFSVANGLPEETFKWSIANQDPSTNAFRLLPTAGVLELVDGSAVDREATGVVDLLIEARSTSNPSRFATAIVHVSIEDVNDSPPEFLMLPYTVTLSEDATKGDRLISIKAKDADLSSNGMVQYFRGPDAPVFVDVNKYDGRITLNGPLSPYTRGQTFSFSVVARDNGKPPLSTTARVEVTVASKHQPIFSHAHYTASVSESATPGATVITVRATPKANGTIGYFLAGGDDRRHFDVDFSTGAITIARPLNRESIPEFNLTVEAVDVTKNNVSGACLVHVVVDDVNDAPPTFGQSVYRFKVAESLAVGSLIGRVQATDFEAGQSVTYAFRDGNQSLVSIDSATGDLHLLQKLDHETVSFYEFIVTAQDADRLAAEAVVQVDVTDVNDTPPKFSGPIPVVINVSANYVASGAFLHGFTATDADQEAVLRYGIASGDETLFRIDPKTGVLSAAAAFDPRHDGSKKLNISVSDGVFTVFTEATVAIVDTGAQFSPSEPLHFDQPVYAAFIDPHHGASNRTAVVVLSARGGQPPLTFAVAGSVTKSVPVAVDESTGRVVVSQSLRHGVELPVQVTDRAGRKAFAHLKVSIRDDNDAWPRFMAPDNGYSVTVSSATQPGESLSMVLAIDDDANDVVEYSLVSSGGTGNAAKYFEVDPASGYIAVKHPLSELKTPSVISFGIRASDSANPPHFVDVPVTVSIVDPLVLVPQPTRLHYLFAVSENAPIGKVVGQLQATSAHESALSHGRSSRNAPTFAVVSNTTGLPFSLDKKNGKIALTQQLDREAHAKYHFVVELALTAKDEKLRSFALVSIVIMDVNDNAPVFSTVYDKITTTEDALPGTVIATFVATDSDEGGNAHLAYYLESPDAYFSIDREYGWLSVAKPLDREVQPTHALTVVVSDDAGQNNSMPVQVIIEDVNDNPPVFDLERYESKISRDVKKGAVVLKFTIVDADLTNNAQVFVIDSSGDGLWTVVNRSRVEAVRDAVLTSDSVDFQLVAFDGAFSTYADVKLVVEKNKGKPGGTDECQTKTEEINIFGNLTAGSPIKRFPSKKHAPIFYHLLDAEQLPFKVDDKNQVVVLDGYGTVSPRYTVPVRAHRPGFSSCVTVLNVTVVPTNAHAPRFEKSEFKVEVKENTPASSDLAHFIVQLEAIDTDFGDFGRLTYSLPNLAADDAKLFSIEPKTGAVVAIASLDKESKSEHVLKIRATDGAGLTGETKLIVVVEDVNDNPPAFEKSSYRLKVLEDEVIGYELARVKAIDPDAGDRVTYSLVSGSQFNDFVKLNPESGVLTLATSLDFEKLKTFSVDVQATDNGQPPLIATTTVDVEVLDVNDNAPRFDKTLYEATIPEDTSVGSKIAHLKVVDADSEHFGKVSFVLSGEDASYFDVDDSGTVLLARAVDYENKSLLRANVKAADGGLPPLSDDTLLSVTVTDVNDNAPLFGECAMKAVVQEDVAPGHAVLTAGLSDADGEGNAGPFRVEITGDGAAAFAFDADMRLIVIQRLSHATKPTYALSATAFDAKGLKTTCSLDIQVTRQSTHPPEIQPLLVTLNTLHGEFLGSKIGRVRASDKDAGDVLRFAIIDDDDSRGRSFVSARSKFSIDPETGVLSALPDLLPGLHRINVSVTDGKFTEFTRVDVDVANIDQDALDHAISLRLKGVDAKAFVRGHAKRFHELLARVLGVQVTDVRFISIQDPEVAQNSLSGTRQTKPRGRFFTSLTNGFDGTRRRRGTGTDSDIDLLFTVSRGEHHGYHRPTWVKQNIEKKLAELTTQSGLQVTALTSEVCRRDVCVKGECRDRLWLDNADQQVVIDVEGMSFASPKHLRTFECLCKQGYSGRHCDVPINMCSKDLCTKNEMCIPSDDEPTGFRCVCPPGFQGSQCAESTCDDAASCSQREAISLFGNGYLQLVVANSMESRLELAVQFRTISANGVLMHGEGLHDFHSLVVANSTIEYRWNSGSGSQTVALPTRRVDDGQWHEVKVARRGRHVRIILDDTAEADATSPPGSDVVNLFTQASLLTFGAKVTDPSYVKADGVTHLTTDEWFSSLVKTDTTRQAATELYTRIDDGITGCIGKVSFDGFELAKTSQGMRLFNAKIGCDTASMGPCLNGPCANGGQCVPGQDSYTCICPKRYTGSACEVDLEACEDKPCPNGIACHNLYNDFLCACPTGFMGKTCQMRGDSDPCSTAPCGPFGTCHRQAASFICVCKPGFGGAYCSEKMPNMVADGATLFSLPEIIVLLAVLILGVFIALVVILLCRRSNKTSSVKGARHPGSHEYDDPNICNPLVPRHGKPAPPVPPHGTNEFSTMPNSAPPLPPRAGRHHHGPVYSNAASGGLPMVEVRPMLNQGSRAYSASSGGKKHSNLDFSKNYGSDDLIKPHRRQPPLPPRSEGSTASSSTTRSSRRPSSSSAGHHGDISSAPLLSSARNPLNDSIQCLETVDDVEIHLDGAIDAGERAAILADVRTAQERLDTATTAWNEPDDYVTMRPVQKIKPFSLGAAGSAIDCRDIDEDDSAAAPPPAPPAHRNDATAAITQTTTTSSKVYDNPHTNDDTLSNMSTSHEDGIE